MEQIDGSVLASFRVRKQGSLPYKAISMTAEQIIARRAYLRKALLNSPMKNLSNEQLDNIRLTDYDNGCYVFEDSKGYEFLWRMNGLTRDESEFRKCRSMIPFEFIGLKGSDFKWDIYNADINSPKGYVNIFIQKFEEFRKDGMGLYIYSSVKGSGKTMLACCILNELADRYPVITKFINILDLLEMTKSTYRGQEQEELKVLYAATVLVIDDIGVQMSKEWVDTVLYRLINSRYNNKLITIYTSNLATDALKIDDRITERISSTTYLVELPEVPVRHYIRTQKKMDILQKIKSAPSNAPTSDRATV